MTSFLLIINFLLAQVTKRNKGLITTFVCCHLCIAMVTMLATCVWTYGPIGGCMFVLKQVSACCLSALACGGQRLMLDFFPYNFLPLRFLRHGLSLNTHWLARLDGQWGSSLGLQVSSHSAFGCWELNPDPHAYIDILQWLNSLPDPIEFHFWAMTLNMLFLNTNPSGAFMGHILFP